jgi:hypothetical protein
MAQSGIRLVHRTGNRADPSEKVRAVPVRGMER